MVVEKILTPPTVQGQIDKINEIIDYLGDSGNTSYVATCPTLTPLEGVVTWTVTHNLGTSNVSAFVYSSAGLEIMKDVSIVSDNAVTISFDSADTISAGAYKVVVFASGGSGGSGGGSADDTFNSSVINANIIGSLTNNNGVISGFSNNPSYATTPASYTLGTNFEFVVKFTMSATVSPDNNEQMISDNGYPAFNFNITNQKLTCQIGTADAWDLDSFVTSTTTLQTSGTYWAKFVYQNSQTKLYMSTDGVTYNLEATSTSSVSVPNITIYLGTGRYVSFPFLGSIDLNDTYLKINGSLVWQGASYKSLTSLAPVTDYYINGTSWYKETFSDSTRTNRIWLEQGGANLTVTGTQMTISFLKSFSNTSYVVTADTTGMDASWYGEDISIDTKSTTGFTCHGYNRSGNVTLTGDWRACGI